MTFAITAPSTIDTLAGQKEILAVGNGIDLVDSRGTNAGLNPPPAGSVTDTIQLSDNAGTFSPGPQTILSGAVASHATLTGRRKKLIDRPTYEQLRAYAGEQDIINMLSKLGYDGLSYRNHLEDTGNLSWVIFRSDQVWPRLLDQPDTARS